MVFLFSPLLKLIRCRRSGTRNRDARIQEAIQNGENPAVFSDARRQDCSGVAVALTLPCVGDENKDEPERSRGDC